MLGFLKLLGKMKATEWQKSHDFLMNWMAKDDWRPNGGLPMTCIFFPNVMGLAHGLKSM
jgi:hypothetical protein